MYSVRVTSLMIGHPFQIKSWMGTTTVCDTARLADRGKPGHGLGTHSQSEFSKQKLKLELLRGSRPKLERLPVSVEVREHLVRAGCMFFGTTTRRTLTRLHRCLSPSKFVYRFKNIRIRRLAHFWYEICDWYQISDWYEMFDWYDPYIYFFPKRKSAKPVK